MQCMNRLATIVPFVVLAGCPASTDTGQVVVEDAGMLDAKAGVELTGGVDASLASDASVDADAADAFSLIDASTNEAGARRPLVDHNKWKTSAAGMDPFPDRPATVTCPRNAAYAETLGGEYAYDVNTGLCDYLTVQQEVLAPVAMDDTLKVRLWHFELSAPEAAQAHASVRIDELILLDEMVDIPTASGAITKAIKAPRAIRAGAVVYFHLHNHGANSWALVEVSAGP